jgi:hypothetical protein
VVRLGRKDNKAWLGVHDNSPGITPEDLPHIFERFFTKQGGLSPLFNISMVGCDNVIYQKHETRDCTTGKNPRDLPPAP